MKAKYLSVFLIGLNCVVGLGCAQEGIKTGTASPRAGQDNKAVDASREDNRGHSFVANINNGPLATKVSADVVKATSSRPAIGHGATTSPDGTAATEADAGYFQQVTITATFGNGTNTSDRKGPDATGGVQTGSGSLESSATQKPSASVSGTANVATTGGSASGSSNATNAAEGSTANGSQANPANQTSTSNKSSSKPVSVNTNTPPK